MNVWLGQQSFHELAMHIRQAVAAALKLVGQSFVIDSQQMHQRGMKIMDMQSVLGCVVAEVVGFSKH